MTRSNESLQTRVHPGVPAGGQFTTSQRREAGSVTLVPPAAPYVAAERAQEIGDALFLGACSQMRVELRDDSTAGYHDGIAHSDIEAWLLMQYDDDVELPQPREVAWEAAELIERRLNPVSGNSPDAGDQRAYLSVQPDAKPLIWSRARAISNLFLKSAIQMADSISKGHGVDINGRAEHLRGNYDGAVENAIRFRSGLPETVDVDRKRMLSEEILKRAEDRSIFHGGPPEPTDRNADEVYDAVFAQDS